ncbi:MAG: PAS domain S-box protein [Gammaproteobacteria bacterium]
MSFRLKIVLGIIVIQVLLLAFVVWSNFHFLRTSNEIELNKHATTTAAVLAATIKQEVAGAERKVLEKMSHEVFAQPGIEYVRIRGRRQVLVALGDPELLARPFMEDFLVEDVQDGVFDVSAEIRADGEVLGYVELGYSLAELDNVMMAARRQTVTISMIGMGLGLFIALMLGNYFARQLKVLRDASRRIASGDIGYQLPVAGNDELAQAARSFNTMSRRLAILYSEKQVALNEAKSTTAELLESKRRVQAVLNNALDGIITIDEQGIIESFNPAAEKIFCYQAGEVVGENVNILMPEPYHAEHDGYLQEYLRTGIRKIIGFGREVVGLRKDGTVFPMEVEISEVQIEGRYLFIGITRDITERKHYEAELQQARDAVLASSRYKFEFIANVSHELRSPLHEILSMSSLLHDSPLDSRQREHIDRIQEAGKSLVTIINDVLDFSKIEAGQLQLEKIPFNIHRTVYEVIHSLREAAQAKDLSLFYLFPPGIQATLRGDPVRLRQILLNLVDNAVKFTSRGEVVIRVLALEETDDVLTLRFEVSDTGIGLSAKEQQRIFETFSQPAAGLIHHYGGSGLGLAISKKLVEMMAGDIAVESTQGKGSIFWFSARFEKVERLIGEGGGDYNELHDLLALVVDDNEARRERLISQLAGVGMTVRAAVDGSHALDELCTAAAKGKAYDVVIFNMALPGMNGLQLARAIGSDSRIADVRMIMITSTGYRGDSEEVRRSGISGYLTTPFDEEMLLNCIVAVLELGKDDRESLITRHNLMIAPHYHQGSVLLIEPDAETLKRHAALLEELDFSVTVAADGSQGIAALEARSYDYILVGAAVARDEAVRLVSLAHGARESQQERRLCRVILIAAAGETEQEASQRSEALGVDDYLLPPLAEQMVKSKLAKSIS